MISLNTLLVVTHLRCTAQKSLDLRSEVSILPFLVVSFFFLNFIWCVVFGFWFGLGSFVTQLCIGRLNAEI